MIMVFMSSFLGISGITAVFAPATFAGPTACKGSLRPKEREPG
jgi:hypothetical protein